MREKEWEEDPPYSSPIFLWALQMAGKKDSCRSYRSPSLSPALPLILYSFLLSRSLCRSFRFLSSVCDVSRGLSLRIRHTCCRLYKPGLLKVSMHMNIFHAHTHIQAAACGSICVSSVAWFFFFVTSY